MDVGATDGSGFYMVLIAGVPRARQYDSCIYVSGLDFNDDEKKLNWWAVAGDQVRVRRRNVCCYGGLSIAA